MEGQLRDLIRRKIVDSLAAPVPDFTRRDIWLPRTPGKAVAVIGMRRTGKTTFLWQVLADKLSQGMDRQALLLFSFEDERLAGMTLADLDLLLEEYYLLNPQLRDRQRVAFFLDEIQVVPGWEGFARRLLDAERVELYLSGSSARLLSREVATSMRGRALEALVHPFSFREYLRFFGREPKDTSRLPKAQRSSLEKDLRVYLETGGFPEALSEDARGRFLLLNSYVDTAVLRDVIERHGVSHPIALRWMVRQLLGNAAGTFSVNKFHGDLHSQNIAVGKDTLHAYLGFIEDAFLVRTVSLHSRSERQRMVNPRKAYPIDTGLIPIFDAVGGLGLGAALETTVLLELERRGARVSYVRTPEGYEVDFLARYPEGGLELIRVCANLDAPATREREVRALEAATATVPRASLHLVGLEPRQPPGLPANVHFHAASSWLLGEKTAHARGISTST